MPSTSRDKPADQHSDPAHDAELVAQLSQIRADLAALTKTLTAFAKDRLDTLPDIAAQPTEQTVANAKRALKDISRDISSVEQQVGRKVIAHPLQSLLIAAGLGFLVAILIRR